MENPHAITVVIPAFGREESLVRAVRSALAEIEPGDDILVVDDGSIPPLRLKAHEQLRVVRSERNRGAAAARNLGVANAANPLIAFLDSDDEWLPGKLTEQRQRFGPEVPAPLLAVCTGWVDTRDGAAFRARIPRPARERSDFFAGCWFAPGSTLMVAREAFDVVGPFAEDLQRLEDYEWFIRFALAGGRLEVVPMLGARIAAGRNARLSAVAASAEQIKARFREDPLLTAGERRVMSGWLDLNVAIAARNDRDWGRLARAIAGSLIARPRMRVQLETWWQWVQVPLQQPR